MADIKDQLIKDSYNYVLQSDLSTGLVYRIGGSIPVNPIFSSGLTINGDFNYSNGTEQPGYVLTTNGSGYSYWNAVSGSSGISGSGTSNYLPKWSGSTSLVNSLVYDSSTGVTIGTGFTWDNTNGRLGIGTSIPSSYYAKKLVVASPDEDGITILANSVSSTSYLAFADGVTGNEAFRGYLSYKHLSDQLAFGSAGTLRMTIASTGNLLINTTTDSGFKLDVNGTSRFNGTTTVSSDLRVNTILPIQNANLLIAAQWADSTNVTIETITNKAQVLIVRPGANLTLTSGTHDTQRITHTFQPTSGNASVNGLTLNQTINQLSGASGTTRGIYINPTISAATDFRAIETTSGKVIFNGGNVGIGTDSPIYKVDVQGTTLASSSVRVQGSFDINPLAAPPVIGGFTLSSGTNLGVGQYYYFVVYVTNLGETSAGATITVTTTSGNTTVNLTGIPISSDSRVTARKLYRTKLGGSSDNQWFLATISNNVTTTYTDSIADASLTGVSFQSYKVNTTARYVTVSGIQGMVIDTNLTTLGRNAGNAIITSNGAAIRTVLIGALAGQNITTGQANVIVGVAGGNLTTGGSNTLIGDLAGFALVNGGSNTIMGSQSGRFLNSASNNVVLGASAGNRLNDGTTSLTAPTNSIYIGVNARGNSDTETNTIVIGNTALGLGSNTTVIGNNSTIFTSIPAGNLGVGTTTNAGIKLDVVGTGRFSGNLTCDTFGLFGSLLSISSASIGGLFATRYVNSVSYAAGHVFQTTTGNVFATSGDTYTLQSVQTVAFTTGTATYTSLRLAPTINQTGGANGITRGLYVNPTISAATDFRAIETTVGNVILNSVSGNTLIGTTADTGTYKLDVSGTVRLLSGGAYLTLNNATYSELGYSNNNYFRANGAAALINGPQIQFLRAGNEVGRFAGTTGNLLIGTTTDSGFKLDVNGVARVSGDITLGGSIRTPNATNLNMIVGNFALQLSSTNPQNTSGSLITTGDITRTDSGTKNIINVNNLVSSTLSSFNILNGYAFTSNITQTQGTIRGLFIAPTLVASTDFRAIETTVGTVVLNSVSGNTLIGKTTDSGQKLQVSGNTLLQGGLTANTISATTITSIGGNIVTKISSGVDSSGNTTAGAFTVLSSVIVLANTFTTGDVVSFKVRMRKSGTNGTVNYRISTNTTLSLTGSQTIGVFNAGATIVYGELGRTLIIKGATSEVFNTSITNVQSDVTTSTSSVSSVSVDWTVDQYIMFNINQASALDTTNISYYSINKI